MERPDDKSMKSDDPKKAARHASLDADILNMARHDEVSPALLPP
jgi:hypothetical protein